MIFEAAHNPQGAEVLDRLLGAFVKSNGRRPVVAVGALGETRARALLEVVARHAREIYLFMPGQSRATPFEILEEFVPAGFAGKVVRSRVDEAFSAGACHLGEAGDDVVVTGSIYLIGEVLERLEEPEPVREARLQD
jgi:dihydrofolate synthase / folylpolyglutamate synthase